MEIVADSKQLTNLKLMKVNPIIDHINITALRAVELMMSVIRKYVL